MSGAETQPEPLLEVRDLRKLYELRRGGGNRFGRGDPGSVHAVDGVSLTFAAGETVGVVGESGCGKSTFGRLVIGLEAPTSGQVLFGGKDLVGLSERALRPYRRSLQIVFQDPFSTLNPRLRIGTILSEALLVHKLVERGRVRARVVELLDAVELPASIVGRYPGHLSGGQRQRVGIARALAVQPSLIVADEPVSALDVSVQAQILNLINRLKDTLGIAWIFIGHNLATVRQVSDRIAVMYLGRVVELGPAGLLLTSPLHPYSQALLDSVPAADPAVPMQPPRLTGDPPSPIDIPPGCRFAARCPLARSLCRRIDPPLEPVEVGREVACWAVSHPDAWADDDAQDDPSRPRPAP